MNEIMNEVILKNKKNSIDGGDVSQLRILFLTSAFNALAQRLYLELTHQGHTVCSQLAIDDDVMRESVSSFHPDLIIAPMLKKAIPEDIWKNITCFIVHPGIVGDKGPSSLDWAILNNEKTWGVTIIEASAEMDAGNVWSNVNFSMRPSFCSKSSLYNNEITRATVEAIQIALKKFLASKNEHNENENNSAFFSSAENLVKGRARPLMTQNERQIHWEKDSTNIVWQKICAGDGWPGTLSQLGDMDDLYYLYNGIPEKNLNLNQHFSSRPGSIMAQKNGAICVATKDGGIWITHLRKKGSKEKRYIKLTATKVLPLEIVNHVPNYSSIWDQKNISHFHDDFKYSFRSRLSSYSDLFIEEVESLQGNKDIAVIHFPFYNGAMSSDQCERLLSAYHYVYAQDKKVIILAGGSDYWSNGIHLNEIEASAHPEDEAWRNIIKMDQLVKEIILSPNCLTIAMMQGNAGAGGVALALAHDFVYQNENSILNPHYLQMGLYGSEYWTYLLPRRVGEREAQKLTTSCLPLGATQASKMGLIDGVLSARFHSMNQVIAIAHEKMKNFDAHLEHKWKKRTQDEMIRPLELYRYDELSQMFGNIYGNSLGFKEKREKFVYKLY